MIELHSWLSSFTACDAADLVHPLATGFVALQENVSDGVLSITGALRREGGEILLATVHTERPQRPVVDIRHEEEIGIFFGRDGYGPAVLVFRDDFPDTPHQARNPVGIPFGICIDDRPWSEARVNYTPAELGQRILQWFRKAARGELHDPAQPMEPIFALHDPLELIMPRGAWGAQQGSRFELVGHILDQARRPNVVTLQPTSEATNTERRLSVLAYDLSAQLVSRMRQAPATLSDLQAEASKRGVDVVADLIEHIKGWYVDPQANTAILRSHLCLVLRLPLINPLNNAVEGIDTIAFIADRTVGDVGAALGIFFSGEVRDLKSVGYQLCLPAGPAEPEKVQLLGCLVHAQFDTALAREISGRRNAVTGKVVMIGGGAIGSSVAESLVREGAFDTWVIMDDDTLLPHNLARHTLSMPDVSHPKSVALGSRLKRIRPDLEVRVFDDNFLTEGHLKAGGTLDDADVIIDASASVAVGRALSDRGGSARKTSIFFNPTGTAAVMLVEDLAHRHDLRFLEALYHRAVLTRPELADHLRASEKIRYTGACRMLTSRIPASRIQILSGLVADGVAKALVEPDAVVQIWSLAGDGGVTVTRPAVDGDSRSIGDWVVNTPGDLSRELAAERERQLPNETGGALLGIVDAPRNRVDLVAALQAPPDSSRSPTEFTRGTTGLRQEVEQSVARCGDQIRYVGEWHSHPRGSSSKPSAIDIEQLAWLTSTMAADGMPGLMFILGENDARQLLGTAE